MLPKYSKASDSVSFAIVTAILIVVTTIEWLLWPFIQPSSWFLFWPAVAICIVLVSYRAAVLAILLATIMAWWFFVPETYVLVKHNPLAYASSAIFILANLLVTHFYNRLRIMRAKADESLRKSSSSHEQLLNALADGVFVAQDYKFVFVNPALPNILGYSHSDFEDKPFSEVIAPGFLEIWTTRFEQRISGGPEPQKYYDTQFIHKAGHHVWIELRANVTQYHDRTAVLGIVRDITQRKAHEARLQLADTVFENAQEGMAVTDLEGNILAVNPAFSLITEYPEDELIGRSVDLMHIPDRSNDALMLMQQELQRTGNWQGALWNRRKGGEAYKEWLVVSTIYNEKKEPVQRITISLDVSRMEHVESHLQYLAQHDALTDLPNRSLLMTRLQHTISRARRKHEMFAVLFIDLDRFKPINDAYGHAAGDEILKVISQRMKARIRDSDTLARMGGDEFVILLDSIRHRDDAAAVARSLIDVIELAYELSSGQLVSIGASIGISVFPEHSEDGASLIAQADSALYQVKGSGRGAWRFVDLN